MGGRRLWALARPGLAGLLDVCGVRTRSLSSLVCKPRANRGASLQGGGKAGTVATDRKRGRGGWLATCYAGDPQPGCTGHRGPRGSQGLEVWPT